ncbi:MAG: hypothetical protein IKP76_02565 [Bacilli bacterium]|nr:hypothetical protein [Bacilli bacterium]
MGKINIIRKAAIFGFAIPFTAIVDGNEVGKLKNGTTITVEIPNGEHTVSIKSLEETIDQKIELTDKHQEVDIKVAVAMGLIAARAAFKGIEYK